MYTENQVQKLSDIVYKLYTYNMDLETLYHYRDLFKNPKTFKELNYLVAFETLIKQTGRLEMELWKEYLSNVSFNPFIN